MTEMLPFGADENHDMVMRALVALDFECQHRATKFLVWSTFVALQTEIKQLKEGTHTPEKEKEEKEVEKHTDEEQEWSYL